MFRVECSTCPSVPGDMAALPGLFHHVFDTHVAGCLFPAHANARRLHTAGRDLGSIQHKALVQRHLKSQGTGSFQERLLAAREGTLCVGLKLQGNVNYLNSFHI